MVLAIMTIWMGQMGKGIMEGMAKGMDKMKEERNWQWNAVTLRQIVSGFVGFGRKYATGRIAQNFPIPAQSASSIFATIPSIGH